MRKGGRRKGGSGVVTGEEIAGVTGEGERRGRRSKDMSWRRHKALRVSQFGEAGAIAGEGGKRSGEPSRRACGECVGAKGDSGVA